MFCCLSGGVALAADVVGSQDLEVLPRFARAEIIEFSQNSGQERVLPTGPLSRISGKLRIEPQVRAEGQLTALTYALPAGHTALDVFNAARNQVQASGAELLYWCQGRDCGSSSLWANSVFANAQLYGSDDQQAYALLRLAAPQQDSLLVLYAITRGNRRAYLHVEQLNASAVYFQEGAWQDFKASMEKTKLVEKIKSERLFVVLTPMEDPQLIGRGMVGGQEVLRIEVPVVLTYIGGSEPVYQYQILELFVRVVPPAESPEGLAIARLKAHPYNR